MTQPKDRRVGPAAPRARRTPADAVSAPRGAGGVARALPLTALLVSPLAFGLGLGSLELHTALTEPLYAEIEVTGVDRGGTTRLDVGLADAEAFGRAGIERPHWLSQLRFQLRERADGSAYVRVTSRQPVNEPYLHFVLRLDSPNGQQLREYTVLLDPPGQMAEFALPRAPAPQTPIVQRIDPPAAAARASARQAAPPPADRDAGRAAVGESASRAAIRLASDYGPIRMGDTLWTIAERAQPGSGFSTEQIMVAILEANPEAFLDGNANQLMAGSVIRIPESARIGAESTGEARRTLAVHERAWRSGTSIEQARAAGRAPVNEPVDEPAAADPPAVAQPRRSAAAAQEGGSDEAGSATPATEDSRLRLLRAEDRVSGISAPPESGDDAAAGAGNGGALRREFLLLEEALDVAQQQNEDLRARVTRLEQQIAALVQALANDGAVAPALMPNDTVAANAAPPDGAGAAEPGPRAREDGAAATPAAEDALGGQISRAGRPAQPQVESDPEAADDAASGELADGAPLSDEPLGDSPGDGMNPPEASQDDLAARPEDAALIGLADTAPGADASDAAMPESPDAGRGDGAGIEGGGPAPAAADTPVAATPVADTVAGSSAPEPESRSGLPGIGPLLAGGAILGLVGGWLAWRRRGSYVELEDPSAAPATAAAPIMSTSGGVAQATLLLARGRTGEAAELLEEELLRNPDNTAAHFQLLRVYYQKGDVPAFERAWMGVDRSLAADDERRGQALRMAQEIGADVAADAVADPVSGAREDIAGGTGDEASDDAPALGAALDLPPARAPASGVVTTEDRTPAPYPDPALDTHPEATATGQDRGSASPDAQVDFSAPSDDAAALDQDVADEPVPAEQAPRDEADSLTFEAFDESQLSEPADRAEDEQSDAFDPTAQDSELEFSLDMGEEPPAEDATGDSADSDSPSERDRDEPGIDDAGFEFDLGSVPEGFEDAPSLSGIEVKEAEDFGALGMPASDRLDLLAAYVEMGDREQAERVHAEIAAAGNAGEQHQAAALMERLDPA